MYRYQEDQDKQNECNRYKVNNLIILKAYQEKNGIASVAKDTDALTFLTYGNAHFNIKHI